jgi:hypothetical protein
MDHERPMLFIDLFPEQNRSNYPETLPGQPIASISAKREPA